MDNLPENIQHSYCAAKWLMVTMHFGMAENHSCYHPPIHRWDAEDVKVNPHMLHNTKQKVEARRQMLSGEKPSECYYCFDMEGINPDVMSDRKRFSSEFWALERNQEIIASSYDTPVNPAYLELSFAHTCNFACSYCSAGQSSKWEHDIRRHGSYPVADPTVHLDKLHDMIPEDKNVYIDAFWQWLPEAYKDLRYLRITGGEPLATQNFMKLLDFITHNHNPDLTVVINTNLCVPEKNLQAFFNKTRALLDANTIKGIEVYTSMDTWGEQAEYIRDGLDIKRWKSTVKRVHEQFGVPIRVMVTFGLLSVYNFDAFAQEIIDMRSEGIDIMYNCARLVDPKQFDLRILPDSADEHFERVNNFINSADSVKIEKETWSMVYDFWKSRAESMIEEDRAWRKNQLQLFVSEYDRRRDKDFNTTFPELVDWISDDQ